MSYQFITSEQSEDGIVVVTINDPDAKNAVNWVMNQELIAEFDRIERSESARADPDRLRADILFGRQHQAHDRAGPFAGAARSDLARGALSARGGHPRVVTGLRRMSKPAIAAINGPAVGSGLGIAAGCDIRIASAPRGSAGCSSAAGSCRMMRASR